jgi:membrane-bound hydrogenase subunit beta
MNLFHQKHKSYAAKYFSWGPVMPELKIADLLKQTIGKENVLDVYIPRIARVFVWINTSKLIESILFLRNQGYTHLSTITGLDLGAEIELLYHLSNGETILTLKVKVPLNDAVVPTITNVIKGAVLYEREVHDLLGVKFEGHPNLKPLILPDDWPKGVYPLRKKW